MSNLDWCLQGHSIKSTYSAISGAVDLMQVSLASYQNNFDTRLRILDHGFLTLSLIFIPDILCQDSEVLIVSA